MCFLPPICVAICVLLQLPLYKTPTIAFCIQNFRSSRCQCAASKRFDWISVNQISNHSKFWSKIRSNSLLESKISELTMQLPKFVLSCWQKSQGFPFCACECAGLCMLDGCSKAVIFHKTSMFFNLVNEMAIRFSPRKFEGFLN